MNTTWGHKTVQDVRVQDRDGVLAKAKGQTTDSAQCSSLESLGQGSAQKNLTGVGDSQWQAREAEWEGITEAERKRLRLCHPTSRLGHSVISPCLSMSQK